MLALSLAISSSSSCLPIVLRTEEGGGKEGEGRQGGKEKGGEGGREGGGEEGRGGGGREEGKGRVVSSKHISRIRMCQRSPLDVIVNQVISWHHVRSYMIGMVLISISQGVSSDQ